MGVIWSVFPLEDRMKSWLDKIGIAYPDMSSRLPTGREIKDVLASLPSHNVDISEKGVGRPWQASIQKVSTSTGEYDGTEWTSLEIIKYSGDDIEQDFYFSKGWETLIILILKNLAVQTGPLVLLPDTGENPTVICPN